LVILSLATCGDDDGDRPGVIQPKAPESTVSLSGTHPVATIRLKGRVTRRFDPREQYKFSRLVCREFGPARIAYENGEAGTITEIAKKWAERTAVKRTWRQRTYRQATFDGCLDGFAPRRTKRR
jgi:hypothetical protein